MQSRRFRLRRASEADVKWLRDLLRRLGVPLGLHAQLDGDNSLKIQWQSG
jgi:hypothetical protein